ncbi:hypothetical protein CHU92_15155 [Flavobacterium cyanobacteriorum]|uniref:Secretion system C-terminal sorting domain-containing protein n=1 Tax=Flavobacterium cyanobacteriorum TaxID=2022802 RepID=A0A255YRZ2_9FLAO|nr:T9SS type A sorting domain-containing protein [Flavobacterium cyanobacteriorum]OYQ31976.1 hypothetical protein CHU92_15155 [Flavobacterium cyanobacteriorum]
MKKQLLFSLLLAATCMQAQTTHHVNWGLGENAAQFSRTIEVGDTVMWMWTSPHPHNVTSNTGSTETFASSNFTGIGNSYSKQFTLEGTNPYRCTFHSSMQGVITVTAVAGTNDHRATDFEFYPNPVNDMLTINAAQVIDRVEVYDMNGRLIMDSPSGNPTSIIYMQNYNAGTYLVKVTAGGKVKTLSVIKQ